eukprot:252773_1
MVTFNKWISRPRHKAATVSLFLMVSGMSASVYMMAGPRHMWKFSVNGIFAFILSFLGLLTVRRESQILANICWVLMCISSAILILTNSIMIFRFRQYQTPDIVGIMVLQSAFLLPMELHFAWYLRNYQHKLPESPSDWPPNDDSDYEEMSDDPNLDRVCEVIREVDRDIDRKYYSSGDDEDEKKYDEDEKSDREFVL